MRRSAEFLVRNRLLILLGIGLCSAFFFYHVLQLPVRTNFAELLPQKHPYVKVHNTIRNIFGGANQVIIMVQVRTGDIFNIETLQKVQWITRELETLPAVDPYKIRSIASPKMKDFKFTSGTMAISALMYPEVPATSRQMQDLRDKIYSNTRYYGNYVAYDSKKTLITVDFFENEIDYRAVFKALSRIREQTEDDNHIISIAGEPMHLGYIDHHTKQVMMVLGITIIGIIVMLYFYYQSLRAVFLPILSALLSAVWGLGFMSLVGFSLDPLIIVLPFLIALMTARHSMQCISRYLEEFEAQGDMKLAAVTTVETMFFAGLTSIITDALGIALVAIATIPILVNIAVACSFWCLATVILSVLFAPLMLACMPETPRLHRYMQKVKNQSGKDLIARLLGRIGIWLPGRGKWYVVGMTALISLVGWNYAAKVEVGDFFPGSSILWPFHRYNKDAFRITFANPLLNPLYVIVQSDGEGGFVTKGETLREIERFQRYIAQHERVMFSLSLVSSLPGFLMSSYEDDPQWCHLPKEDRVLSFCARKLVYTGEPGTWDQFVDMQDKNANIVIYCRDKMPKTVESVVRHIQAYLDKTPGPPGGRYLLAGGAVGVQAAVREVIADSQTWNLLLALGGIFLFCTLNYRSALAGIILTIPLAISNILTFALMGAYHIGLTVNTYPVSSIGIGLGVDYGIYFISRLREEYRACGNLNKAIFHTLTTNGRAIIQIATTLTIGLMLWIFSALKFQAEMGILLAILLFLNMLGALLLVPSLICIIKPKFVQRA